MVGRNIRFPNSNPASSTTLTPIHPFHSCGLCSQGPSKEFPFLSRPLCLPTCPLSTWLHAHQRHGPPHAGGCHGARPPGASGPSACRPGHPDHQDQTGHCAWDSVLLREGNDRYCVKGACVRKAPSRLSSLALQVDFCL